jgi:2-amino-4-hydroxy-6-hydroxymethyldihydropteridine diphosphokinase
VGGPEGQDRYLNAVAELETALSPRALLQRLLAIERRHGRRRTVRHGPRTLDLDLLLYGDRVINEPELTVPHPRMWERPFVMGPLSEICDVDSLPVQPPGGRCRPGADARGG